MKKQLIRKLIISFIMLLMSIVLITTSNAASELAIGLAGGKKEVKVGDEVEITISLNETIVACNFDITYNQEIYRFEESATTGLYASVNDDKLSCIYYDLAEKGTSILKLKFKALKETSAKTTFGLENVKFRTKGQEKSYTENDIQGLNNVLIINSVSKVTTGDTIGNTTGNTIENTTGNTIGNTNGNIKGITTGKTTTSTEATKILPKAGTRENCGYVLLICSIFLMLSAIFKYKENELNKIFKAGGLMLVITVVTLTTVGNIKTYAADTTGKIEIKFYENLIGNNKNATIALNNNTKNISKQTAKSNDSNIIEIKNSNGKTIEDTTNIKTGDKIQTGTEEYEVILYGDSNKDGTICGTEDIMTIVNDYLGKNELEGIEKIAANLANEDEKLDTDDIMKMINVYNGESTNIVDKVPEGSIEPKKISDYVKIGDYVEYTPQSETTSYTVESKYSGYDDDQEFTQDNLKWRVLNINEDGTIDLISDGTISENVYLEGALGYNNGVYLLNDYCKTLYSNEDLNAISRSLNIEDIINKMDLNVWNYHSFSGYGTTKKYETDKNYPYQWTQEKTEKSKIDGSTINGTLGQSEQEELTEETYDEATTSIEVEQIEWYRSASDMEVGFKKANTRDSTKTNSMYYELLCDYGKSDYFLASRGTGIEYSSGADFGLKFVVHGDINYDPLITSNAAEGKLYYSVRPVVSLKSNIINLDTDYNTTGTWKLK